MKGNNKEADYFFKDQMFKSFAPQTKGRDLNVFDLKQSMEPVTNKPILTLKVNWNSILWSGTTKSAFFYLAICLYLLVKLIGK